MSKRIIVRVAWNGMQRTWEVSTDEIIRDFKRKLMSFFISLPPQSIHLFHSTEPTEINDMLSFGDIIQEKKLDPDKTLELICRAPRLEKRETLLKASYKTIEEWLAENTA
jgi:hypothetical protein